jgi:sporulation protein YlmC with PRC-barrel domain
MARTPLARVACLLASIACFASAVASDPPVRALEIVGTLVLQPRGTGIVGSVTDMYLDPAEHRIAALGITVDGRPRVCAVRTIEWAGEASATQRRPVRLPEGCEKGGITAEPSWRRVSEITAAHVRDKGNAVVGDVKDLFVEPASGRVTFALVDFVPAWFSSEGWAAVPIASLEPDGQGYIAAFDPAVLRPAEKPKPQAPAAPARADVRLSKLVGRPVVGADGKPLGRVSALRIDVEGHRLASAEVESDGGKTECLVGAGGLALAADAFHAAGESLAGEPGCGAKAHRDARWVAARDLLAAGVRDDSGEEVGRIREVVVALDTAKVHYLVADFRSGWVRDGDVVALPTRPVERKDGRLYVHASLMELQGRPVFEEKRLADVWSPVFAKGMDKYLYGR